jgi:transcriptional regulator with XRE-family HTH domain
MRNRLRELRHERGVPLLELAAKARASTATISMIERFDYLPGEALRERLAQALGVSTLLVWPDLVNSSGTITPNMEEEDAGDTTRNGPEADV